jgi:hypothetical protein
MKMPQQCQDLKRLKTGPHRFMAFAQKRRKPVQTGSHGFLAFAKKK